MTLGFEDAILHDMESSLCFRKTVLEDMQSSLCFRESRDCRGDERPTSVLLCCCSSNTDLYSTMWKAHCVFECLPTLHLIDCTPRHSRMKNSSRGLSARTR